MLTTTTTQTDGDDRAGHGVRREPAFATGTLAHPMGADGAGTHASDGCAAWDGCGWRKAGFYQTVCGLTRGTDGDDHRFDRGGLAP